MREGEHVLEDTIYSTKKNKGAEKENPQKKRCSHLQVMACDLYIVGINNF